MGKKPFTLFIEESYINKIKRISNKKQVVVSRLIENCIRDLKEDKE